jgi:hypothetical protein
MGWDLQSLKIATSERQTHTVSRLDALYCPQDWSDLDSDWQIGQSLRRHTKDQPVMAPSTTGPVCRSACLPRTVDAVIRIPIAGHRDAAPSHAKQTNPLSASQIEA